MKKSWILEFYIGMVLGLSGCQLKINDKSTGTSSVHIDSDLSGVNLFYVSPLKDSHGENPSVPVHSHVTDKGRVVFTGSHSALSALIVKRLIRYPTTTNADVFDDSIAQVVSLSPQSSDSNLASSTDDFTISLSEPVDNPFAMVQVGYRLQSGSQQRDVFIDFPRDVVIKEVYPWPSGILQAQLGVVILSASAQIEMPSAQVRLQIQELQAEPGARFKTTYGLKKEAGELDLTINIAQGKLVFDYSGAQGEQPSKPSPIADKPPKATDAYLTSAQMMNPALCQFKPEEPGQKGLTGQPGLPGGPGYPGGTVSLHLGIAQGFIYEIKIHGGPGGNPGLGGNGGPGGDPGNPLYKIFTEVDSALTSSQESPYRLDPRNIIRLDGGPATSLCGQKYGSGYICYRFTGYPGSQAPSGDPGSPGADSQVTGPPGANGLACVDQTSSANPTWPTECVEADVQGVLQ